MHGDRENKHVAFSQFSTSRGISAASLYHPGFYWARSSCFQFGQVTFVNDLLGIIEYNLYAVPSVDGVYDIFKIAFVADKAVLTGKTPDINYFCKKT